MRLRYRRFPFLLQLDSKDCGPSCLAMIAQYHGRRCSREALRELCHQDRQGTSIGGLARAAEHLGFRAVPVRISLDVLLTRAPLPCIAYSGRDHFVVIHRIKRGIITLADPAIGMMACRAAQFAESWLDNAHGEPERGIVLLLQPTQQFFKRTEERSIAEPCYFRPALREFRRHGIQIALAALMVMGAQSVAPYLGAAIVDQGIQGGDFHFVQLTLMAQLLLHMGRVTVDLLQGWLLGFIGCRIDMSLTSAFLIKLMRLPLAFFDGRLIGDLMQRIEDHDRIRELLTEYSVQFVLALLSLLTFGGVLAAFNVRLFGVFLAGGGMYVVFVLVFTEKRKILDYRRFRANVRHQTVLFELMCGMQEIKLNNAEERKRWEWEQTQQELFDVNLTSLLLNQWQIGGGSAINELKNLVISAIAAQQVISGNITIGTMFAVQYIIGQLSWPLNQLIMVVQRAQLARLSMERALDIFTMADEDKGTHPVGRPLTGDIEMSGVRFGYVGTGAGAAVFDDLSLTIPEGKTTAIVGESGCGKTTLLKLLLKFYSPQVGQITVGSVDMRTIPHFEWRQCCGVVMQDGYIFSDTILNNIAVGVESIDEERVAAVTRLAQIDEFIEHLPLDYSTKIGRDGTGLSKGQEQRILLARALYRDPRYVFLDEATSALDAETERLIVDGLRSVLAGKTVVVVAHRMSTVRHADQIVVLDSGKIIECGVHSQLTKAHGRYYELVRNQLDLAD